MRTRFLIFVSALVLGSILIFGTSYFALELREIKRQLAETKNNLNIQKRHNFFFEHLLEEDKNAHNVKDLLISRFSIENRFGLAFKLKKPTIDIFLDGSVHETIDPNAIEAPYGSYRLMQIDASIVGNGKHWDERSSAYLNIHEGALLMVRADGGVIIVDIAKISDLVSFDTSKPNGREIPSLKAHTIPSNIQDFVSLSLLNTMPFGIKGSSIHGDDLYVSYIREVRDGCFNTSLLRAKFNRDFLEFKSFFTYDECIEKYNDYGEFTASASGGKLVRYGDHYFFTIGAYRYRPKAQDLESMFGKVVRLTKDGDFDGFASLGHRNPQGLFADKKRGILLSSEHGPRGGDEINIISPKASNVNYGWPISSYGEHYSGDFKPEAPLHKNHKDYGFIEPVRYFVPSVAPSEIISIPKEFFNVEESFYALATMGYYTIAKHGSHSIIFFKIENGALTEEWSLPMGERVRDIVYSKTHNAIFMFLGNTGTIGVLQPLS